MSTPESRLARAEAVLSSHEVQVPTAAKVRARRRVFDAPRPARITWTHASLACAACAGIVLFQLAPVDPPPPALAPSPSPWLSAGATHQVGPATVRPQPGAEIQLADVDGVEVLRLWRGDVEIALPSLPAPQFVEVQTMQGRIQCVGGRFSIHAEASQTLLTVHQGAVSVITDPQAPPVPLAAGRQVRLSPKAKAPATTAAATPPAAAATPHAAAVAPPRPKAASTPQQDLQTARRWLPKDANRAGDLAERVVDARPDAPIELQALFVLADARRRAGRNAEASQVYARVLSHPKGVAFKEEAHFHRAHLLHEMGRLQQAEAELQTAHVAQPNGPLAPERGALMALIRLQGGDLDGAARALEQVPEGGWSRILDERRLEVARALVTHSGDRAAVLARQIVDSGRAPDLVAGAKKVLAEVRKSEGQSASGLPMGEP